MPWHKTIQQVLELTGMEHEEMSAATKAPGLPHPFALGSVVSMVLGTIALYVEMQNLNYWQSPIAASFGPILIFGYFPITVFISPFLMAVIAYARYHNTKGLWWYFGGSAIFGLIYSFFIWGLLFVGFILSGPP